MAEEDCFEKLNDMQADIYRGFSIRSIHPALSFTFTINACNTGKVLIIIIIIIIIIFIEGAQLAKAVFSGALMEKWANGPTEKLIIFNMTCLCTFHTNLLLHRDYFSCMYTNNYEHLPK